MDLNISDFLNSGFYLEHFFEKKPSTHGLFQQKDRLERVFVYKNEKFGYPSSNLDGKKMYPKVSWIFRKKEI